MLVSKNIAMLLSDYFPIQKDYFKTFLKKSISQKTQDIKTKQVNQNNKKIPNKEQIRRVSFISGTRLGDTLIMTPAIRLFKKLNPDVHIEYFFREKYQNLFRRFEAIDRLKPVSTKDDSYREYYLGLAKEIEQNASESDVYIWALCPKNKINDQIVAKTAGFHLCGPSFMDSSADGIMYSFKNHFDIPLVHDRWGFSLIRPFTEVFSTYENDYIPFISQNLISHKKLVQLKQKFKEINFSKPFIFFNPYASHPTRSLTPDQIKRLINLIHQNFKEYQVYINSPFRTSVVRFARVAVSHFAIFFASGMVRPPTPPPYFTS
jgi:ADP-heptose:LPS heptosyltransferase